MRHLRTATTIAAATFLASCASVTPPAPLRIEPVQQVRHSTNEVAAAYYQLGRQHQQRGDLELALTAYNYAAARDPSAPEPRSAAAAVHAQQGRLAQAHALLLAVTVEYPRLAQAHNNLGYVHHLRGDYAAAAASFTTALALAPHNAYARNNLALARTAGSRSIALQAPPPAPPSQVSVAPAPQVAARPVAVPVPGSLQLVKLGPNQYHLKLTEAVQAVAVAVPASKAVVPVTNSRAWRLEVANGNGEPGLARRTGKALLSHGIAVKRLSNERPFGRMQTTIEFRPGFAQQARSLQAKLGGDAILTESEARPGGMELRLVLGRNAQRTLAMLDKAEVPVRLAVRKLIDRQSDKLATR